MKSTYIWSLILCLFVFLFGCENKYDHKGKTPLVEVDGNYLYREDLQLALPLNLSTEDSVLFAENYIQNWVEDVLLFGKAEDNVRDSDRVKELVESYRKALVMHAYQEALVKQQLTAEITDTEITGYYEENKTLFVLDEPIVKGVFIKVPLHSTGLADVRRWYKRNNQESIEKLEKYSLRNAVTYDYFYDKWRPLEDVKAMIPTENWKNVRGDLKGNSNFELKDTAYHYFLHIEEFQGEGGQKPLDFAQEEIKEILTNLKRVDFINRVKDDLFRQASTKNGIIYYYLKSDE